MNYHEDGYGGSWYDDNEYTPDDPDYQAWYDDYPDNYDEAWSDPNWRERLWANLRFWLHLIRMRVDRHYREYFNDLPF